MFNNVNVVYFQHKCDLINMSYGEGTLLPDYGRFVDLVDEVKCKAHNRVCVCLYECSLITIFYFLFIYIFLMLPVFLHLGGE